MQQPDHELVARDWYHRAHQDWKEAQALALLDPESPNAVWLVQQAVEKAIKSLLILEQVKFRRMHALEPLRELLPVTYRLRTVPKDLSVLSQRGAESRYPGEYDPVDAADVRLALRLGKKCMELLVKEFDPHALFGIDPGTGQPYEK
jgi:HEPN domain-containing protein